MSISHHTTHSAPGAGFVNALLRAASRALAAISAWNEARRTRNALNRLSDRELDDIGLSRADIDFIR